MTTDKSIKYHHFLDASSLRCPMPILETKRQIKQLNAGEILLVKTKDPSFEIDVKAFAKASKDELLKIWQEDNHIFAQIKKS